MRITRTCRQLGRATAWANAVAVVASVTLLAGCVTATNTRTVYDGPTLHPGDTVTCISNPCDVYFETPAGSGTHEVLQGTIKAGEVTGGQRTYLGSYWAGPTNFTVTGTDLPTAYLMVMGQE